MSDPNQTPASAQAEPEEMSQEQLWAEIVAEEDADRSPPAQGADVAQDFPAEDAEGDEPPADGDQPAEGPSEDDGDGTPAKDDTVSTDPKALQATIDRLQHALASEKGRTASSRREIETLRAQIAEATALQSPKRSVDDTLTNRLTEASEQYPDVVAPVVETVRALQAEVEALRTQGARTATARQQQLQGLLDSQRETFLTEHPDGFDTIIAHRKAFDDWIEDQPKAMRDLYADNRDAIIDGQGAALLVAKFKQALLGAGKESEAPANPTKTNTLSPLRQRQLDGARSPRGGTAAISSATPDRDADPEAQWKYWAQKEREMEGRGS